MLPYEYFLGLLNSKLLQYIFEKQNPQMVGKVFAEIKVIYVERLPILLTGDNVFTGVMKQLVSLVKEMP